MRTSRLAGVALIALMGLALWRARLRRRIEEPELSAQEAAKVARLTRDKPD